VITHHPIQKFLGFLESLEGFSFDSLFQPGASRRGSFFLNFLDILEEATILVSFPTTAETGLI